MVDIGRRKTCADRAEFVLTTFQTLVSESYSRARMCGRGLCRHAQAVKQGNGPETKPHRAQSPRLEHSPARTPADSKRDVAKMLGDIVHTLGARSQNHSSVHDCSQNSAVQVACANVAS